MNKEPKFINLLLLDATSSSEALARLQRLRKSQEKHWSLQFVCKKAGIPSTGYFSDVMSGKRSLHMKHLKGISRAFGLSPLQVKYLEALLSREQSEDAEEKRRWDQEIIQSRDLLQMEFIPLPEQLSQGLLFHILVLSSFSLFPEGPTQAELENHFGKSAVIPLGKSLHKLEAMALIEKRANRYALTNTRIMFQESSDGFSHAEFMENAIRHAASQVRSHFSRSQDSMFLSTFVTIRKADYEAKVPEIKKRILEILADLDAKSGDQLLSFNLQAFPIDPQSFNKP